MSFSLIALAAQAAAPPDPALARMVALYDEVCLRAFPDDKAVDAAMTAHGFTALTPDEVKVTLVDDPGRGWRKADGDHSMSVFLELPPYHACSVRRGTTAGFADMGAYRTLADGFEKGRPGFVPIEPMEGDVGDIHVHAVGEQRPLPDGGAEALYVFDQHINDPARRAKGDTGVEMRFVHQLAPAGGR